MSQSNYSAKELALMRLSAVQVSYVHSVEESMAASNKVALLFPSNRKTLRNIGKDRSEWDEAVAQYDEIRVRTEILQKQYGEAVADLKKIIDEENAAANHKTSETSNES
jgi:hypothetical protein